MVPSHQALVLPLKRRFPQWFSGLGLVLGTMAPDLAFVLRLDEHGSPLSHSVVGLFVVAVPLVVVLHALATALVFPWLLPHLPGGPPFHLHALARCRPVVDVAGLARLARSALVGAATHVFLDGFTHGNHSGWALAFLPVLATPVPHVVAEVPLHDALQIWLTIGLGALALRDWHWMASALPPPGPGAAAAWEVVKAPNRACQRMAAFLLGAALAGAVLAPTLKGAIASPDALKLAVYGTITFSSLAALLGAALARLRRNIGPSRLKTSIRPEGLWTSPPDMV